MSTSRPQAFRVLGRPLHCTVCGGSWFVRRHAKVPRQAFLAYTMRHVDQTVLGCTDCGHALFFDHEGALEEGVEEEPL